MLGQTLTDEPQLRSIVCAGLINLISSLNVHLSEGQEKSHYDDEYRNTLSLFSKNFLPLFFNLFGKTQDSKYQILEATESYLSVSDSQVKLQKTDINNM